MQNESLCEDHWERIIFQKKNKFRGAFVFQCLETLLQIGSHVWKIVWLKPQQ